MMKMRGRRWWSPAAARLWELCSWGFRAREGFHANSFTWNYQVDLACLP